jgi:transposase-like protein
MFYPHSMSLLVFLKRFPDDASCWAHLEAVRWPDGPICPKCGSVNDAHLVGRAHYRRCNGCRAKFKVTHGTPFEGTHLPMRTWFKALYLTAAASKSLSSVKLAEHLGVGQKTAWSLGQRIRRIMEDKDGLLSGIVEADKANLVGKKRKKEQPSKRDPDDDQPTGRGGSRRSVVTVVTERGGRARTSKGKTHSERTIAAIMLASLDIGRTALVTDELAAYRRIGSELPAHLHVKYSQGEYVGRGHLAAADAHISTVEAFNATLKRALIGVWHWLSVKHTDRCLQEVSFRRNRRAMNSDACLAGLFTSIAGRLRWKELVA